MSELNTEHRSTRRPRVARALLVASLAVAAVSCVRAHTIRELFRGRRAVPQGHLELSFASDVPWPLRVARAGLALDGRRVSNATATPVPPGVHVVAVHIELRWQCAVASSEAIAHVTHSALVEVGPRGGSARMGIVGRGTAFDIPERRFAFVSDYVGDARRSRLRSLAAVFVAEAQQRCGPQPSAAFCRVQHLADRARERRDIIDLTCKTEKLLRMQSIIAGFEETGPNQVAFDQLVSLEREALSCVGEDIITADPQVTIARPCQGEMPDP